MTAAVALTDRLPFAVRPGTPDDHALVMDSWLLSAKESDGHTEGRLFLRWQKRMQRAILARPTTRLRVCHPDGDPVTILGWLAYAETLPRVIYYAYTRYASRRLGVATMLLDELASEREVICAARPARQWDEHAKLWVAHPVNAKIPRTWRTMPRANYEEP